MEVALPIKVTSAQSLDSDDLVFVGWEMINWSSISVNILCCYIKRCRQKKKKHQNVLDGLGICLHEANLFAKEIALCLALYIWKLCCVNQDKNFHSFLKLLAIRFLIRLKLIAKSSITFRCHKKWLPRVRLELTAFRLWDWRAAYCATEASWRKSSILSLYVPKD